MILLGNGPEGYQPLPGAPDAAPYTPAPMSGDGFTLGIEDLKEVMRRYLQRLREQREALDRLNVYPVPDGDTGTNMTLTMESVVAETDRAASMADLARGLAHGSLMGAQGNSGIILAEILREIAGVLDGRDSIDARHLADGLRRAADAAYGAVARPQEGTILTVLRASARAAADGGRSDPEALGEFLGRVYRGAEEALRKTPEQLPALKEAGVVDAGGGGYLLLLAAFLDEVTGEAVELPPELGRAAAARVGGDPGGPRYEVIFLLDGPDGAGKRLMESWGEIGESIVVVGGEGMWSCHIHTDDVGAALEAGVSAGSPHRIQVTDLFAQAADEAFHRETSFEALEEATTARVGVVAVASGRGAIDLFRDAGAQGIVVGGQTMNPSVRDLLDAVESAPAGTIVVLPNNRNVVPAAEQVDSLTKKRVLVVPTRSVPQGLAALIEYHPSVTDAARVAVAMTAAASRVTTAEVTSAVRDATTPAGPVRAGDWLGMVEGSVVAVVSSRPSPIRRFFGFLGGRSRRVRVAESASAAALTTILIRVLDSAVDEDAELVTLLTGSSARATSTDAARRWLAEQRPGAVVEVLAGGQPFHPYVLGVE